MQVDFIIVGQGICGSFLSHYLLQEQKTVLVFDELQINTPSRIAAGVINPVTGRRIVKTWLIDELLPFIKNAYGEIENKLERNYLSQKDIIDFFPNPFMREGFLSRINENADYIFLHKQEDSYADFFNYEFGYGTVSPTYTAHLEAMLPDWRNFLLQHNCLVNEKFDTTLLHHTDEGIIYQDIKAEKIIFCDGAVGVGNSIFHSLPFAPNKGEALIVEINGLPDNFIYKKGLTLVPLLEKNMFWIGSNYLWEFQHDQPSDVFRKTTEEQLKKWLRLPYKMVDHRAALRPATLERRPFVGLHPMYKNIGLLNGMGTKGCSLAPYFARQLTDHLLYHKKIMPEADINRFSKILSKL